MTGTHTDCDDNDMLTTNVVTVSNVSGCISAINDAGKEHEKHHETMNMSASTSVSTR